MRTRIGTYQLSRKIAVLPSLAVLLTTLIIAITWYVVATNAYVSMRYVLSDQSELRASLIMEIETLQTRIASETKPETLEQRANDLGFITIVDPKYMSVPGNAVARR